MQLIDIIMRVEQEGLSEDDHDVIEAIGEHRDTLRTLQGFWGRLIETLEARGYI